jgi:hypothetical protein
MDVVRLLILCRHNTERTLESLVKQEARGMAVELARATRPMGFSYASQMRGEKSVAADIYRVLKPPSFAYERIQETAPELADRFWAAATNRRFAKANQFLNDPASPLKGLSIGRLNPQLHRDSRTGPWANVPRCAKPKQIVSSEKALDNYVTSRLKMVGFAKGSWMNAAKAIGGKVRGAEQWVTRHKKAPGTAVVRGGENPSVTLINSLGYIDQVCPPSATDFALEQAAARLKLALKRSLRYIAEKTNRALRRRAA